MCGIRKRVDRRRVDAERYSMPPIWMQLRKGLPPENIVHQNRKRA
jgi:hypothetical protein